MKSYAGPFDLLVEFGSNPNRNASLKKKILTPICSGSSGSGLLMNREGRLAKMNGQHSQNYLPLC